MRQAYICAFPPTLGSGRALRTYTCVRALATYGPVDYVYAAPGGEQSAPEYRAIPGIGLHPVFPSRRLRRGAGFLRMVAADTPVPIARGCSPEFGQAAREAAASGYDRVVIEMEAAPAILQDGGRSGAIYNAHNLESGRRQAGGHRPSATRAQMRRFERKILRAVAETWMVSRADVDGARRLAPEASIRYVPNAVDVAAIVPVDLDRVVPRALMVADYTYGPNAEGADYLANEVMPNVWRTLPDARARLVGRGLDPGRYADPRIEVAGFVDDLAAAYAGAGVVAVPLLRGGGSPLKFIEALAYGMPVVATPLAAAGLEVAAGIDYLAAAGPEQFAAALATVLAHGAPAIARAGRALAEREYSIEALARAVGP